ncbi:hypothetical protein [Pseudomonas sp. N040]|uniref:hypothetical protein n=1 Tax=Pseudomonas sp. N040 TaxID=2785325 RepID=UPI0018A27462|nr:hypothetical protein [Pseudomonas sp. N040]MBF7729153.1 hypothetical protein [Pseudomonas sp. N040]MBW7012793.1 hypothetical protein [Pseudomonas sp. N040]
MNDKLLIGIGLCLCSALVQADYLDVIDVKLKPACTLKDFIALNKEMNEWGKPYNMTGEVVTSIFSDAPNSTAWVGRSPDATSFGKAWDAWRTARDKGEAPVSKLNARWVECTEILYRRAFDSY